MGYKTLFGGYTPDLDLSLSDWTKRWNTAASATVRGVDYAFIDSSVNGSGGTSYTFSGIIPEAGRYVIGVVGQGAGTVGVQGVSVDGQLGSEILELTEGTVFTSYWVVDPTSFADGDINVLLNSAHNRCAIVVWQIYGDDSTIGNSATGNANGVASSITTVAKNVLLGLAMKDGNADANDYFWSNLKERVDELVAGTSYWSIADRTLVTEDTSYEINLTLNAAPTNLRWTALPFATAVTYFPSGQGVRFEKQSSDARAFWSWDTVGQQGDVEVLALIRPILSGGNFFSSGPMARASGAASVADGYGFYLGQSTPNGRSALSIEKLTDNVASTLATKAFSWSLNTNYWMRFQLRGSTIKGRIWIDGTDEPGEWDLEAEDDTHSSGYVGIFHLETASSLEVGHFEARRLYAEWPAAVPFNWTVDMAGGPQSNKIAFKPDVGPTIDRRRATSVTRKYQVECPGLEQDEYIAFVDFYHTTLKEGTLPFNARDPFTGVEKTWKFSDDDPAYQESFQRPVGEDYGNGLYKVMFSVIRLD